MVPSGGQAGSRLGPRRAGVPAAYEGKTKHQFRIIKVLNHTNRIFRFGFGKIRVIFVDSDLTARLGSYFRFEFEIRIRCMQTFRFGVEIRDSGFS